MAEYHPLALDSWWDRRYWQGLDKLICRRVLKIFHLYKDCMRFLDFRKDVDYEVVFLIPPRYRHLIKNLKAVKSISNDLGL